jgi:hypothetical protein
MGGVKRGEAGRVCGKSRDDNGPGTKHVCDQKCVQNFVRGGDLKGKDQPMRPSFFWDVTQRRLIVIYRTFRDNLSVPKRRYYMSTLRNVPEEQR